jgi:hypothetical protein
LSRASIRMVMASVLAGACQGQIGPVTSTTGNATGAAGSIGSAGSGGPGVPAGSAGAVGPAGSSGTVGTGSGGNTGGPGSGRSPPPPLDCSQARASTAHLRVLTESQYSNSVLDIFQIAGNPAKGVGPSLDDVSLEQRAELAATIATQAIANLTKWAPCTC